MNNTRRNNKEFEAEKRRMEELDFSFRQVNDYPLSDKTLVVNPQTIPLTVDNPAPIEKKDI